MQIIDLLAAKRALWSGNHVHTDRACMCRVRVWRTLGQTRERARAGLWVSRHL